MRSIFRAAAPLAFAATLAAFGSGSAVPSKPDEATILHVLGRAGFGARPGDVDRVRQAGLDKYIDQQLHPERIPDTQMNGRLSGLSTLTMSSRALADEYYEPALRARQDAKKEAAAEPSMNESAPKRTPEQTEAARKARVVVMELSAQKILR